MKIDSGTLTQVTNQDINPDGTFVIPAGVTAIGDSAFFGCSGLTTVAIPDSVTTIGENAFYGCIGLTSLTIPDSVITIGDNAFYGCIGLTSLMISDIVTMIAFRAFYNCSGLTALMIPESVTTIGSYAFHNCIGLTALTIPEGVTTISDHAFSNCRGLTTVTIPGSVTNIGSFIFNGCSKLSTLVVPDNVTTIGDCTFSNCIGLTTVTIPDSVTMIGGYAFAGCHRLTALTISDSVIKISDSAFSKCDILEHIYVSQAQQGGFERVRDLFPAHLRNKVTAVSPAGRLTKGASASSIVAGFDNIKKPRLFTASESISPLATLLQETKKQISTPGQVQLIFKTTSEAETMQRALEQAGMHAGASAAAQYAIEDISKIDESEETASAAGSAAIDSPSGFAITLTKGEYNQLMEDPSAYDQLSQSAKNYQTHRPSIFQ